jgi:hypothetical protein
MKYILVSILTVAFVVASKAQSHTLSLRQQKEDFEIFKGGLQEGHAGIYYFIDKKTFDKKCDSIENSFAEGSTIEDFYLKMRYIVASLNHGHTRISLPSSSNINYKMAVLDSTKYYLPFQFVISKDKLIILEDCTKEQIIPKYSIVKSINDISSEELVQRMLLYMPADGANQSYKRYSLYNYYYFHHLFNLFYPGKQGVKVELQHDNTHYYIETLKPKSIDSIYAKKNHKSISSYDKQLDYQTNFPQQTAYLKVASFYKGLIENFGQQFEPFLDSCFSDMQKNRTRNLIIDVRDNEGGGDNYSSILFSYLNEHATTSKEGVLVAGRTFKYKQYAANSSADVKTFMEDPSIFLEDDTTLLLKKEYSDQVEITPKKNFFDGNIYVLTNGGTFSAGTGFVGLLYNYRMNSQRKIYFIGEENGGDIYSKTQCAGQSYIIDLPNTKIKVDMPFLCFGQLNKTYPKKRLPDFEVYQGIKSFRSGKDAVLEFALELASKK